MIKDQDLWREHLANLGEFIKRQRLMNQMSQRQLARLADLSDTYMSQIERGRHEPSLSVLRALAESLGVRPDQLILYAAGLPLPDESTMTEDAIRGDHRLTPAQRTALLAVLGSYLEANEREAAGESVMEAARGPFGPRAWSDAWSQPWAKAWRTPSSPPPST